MDASMGVCERWRVPARALQQQDAKNSPDSPVLSALAGNKEATQRRDMLPIWIPRHDIIPKNIQAAHLSAFP
jgi:hypothetical protein